jgi:LytS/YehU family sensor histidine kinase
LLLPPLVVGYLLAVYLYRKAARPWLMWSVQFVAGLTYAAAFRPMFYVSILLVHGKPDYYMDAPMSFFGLLTSAVFLWISSTTSNFVLYLLGVFLMMVLFSRVDLAEERLRLERLSSEWLAIKLRTLQWQINPHFLFNSLNTVSSLLRSSPGRADQVLAKFSELLRMTLREQENVYSQVNAELEYIHRYLDMEKVRFEDRLKLKVEADEDALEARVPSLLLQPLIENAIKHGVARIPGPAWVEVSVARQGASLLLVVKNSSPGVQAASPASPGTGLGIRNLGERLSTIYRESFRFKYGHDADGAWVSTIEIPYEIQLSR